MRKSNEELGAGSQPWVGVKGREDFPSHGGPGDGVGTAGVSLSGNGEAGRGCTG